MTATTDRAPAICRNPDCGAETRSPRRGYCLACYRRAHRAGFPAIVSPPQHGGPYSNPPVAHTCKHCGAGFLAYVSDERSYCSTPCRNAHLYPAQPHPVPTDLIVTPAMLGIAQGQPPTDPNCTPDRVWQIANTNTRRALQWLARHTDLSHREALDVAIWNPAAPSDDARRAA